VWIGDNQEHTGSQQGHHDDERSAALSRELLRLAVIEYMTLGHSAVAFAGNIGVSRATLETWGEEHPAFARALAIGRAKAVTFWEQKLAEIASSGKGNASAAIFGLKNATAEWTAAEGPGGRDSAERDVRFRTRATASLHHQKTWWLTPAVLP
jgi:hypothetical protein